MSDWYKLDENRNPVKLKFEDVLAMPDGSCWARVDDTDVLGKVRVSTVFLGLDHQFEKGGRPLIFETMVFGGSLDDECERYSTWAEAETGHAAMVERVKHFEEGC